MKIYKNKIYDKIEIILKYEQVWRLVGHGWELSGLPAHRSCPGPRNDDKRERPMAAKSVSATSIQTLSHEVYEHLRADIRNGTLDPGKPLRMEWLKETYGFGATPLREALTRLAAEHLATAQGGRGFRVAEISGKEFEELLTLREDLEYKALKDALVKGDDAWETNIVACYYSLSKMAWDVVNDDPNALEEREVRHRAFHAAVIAACGSSWLIRMWEQLSAHEERYRRIAMSGVHISMAVSKEIEKEHQQIVEAVVSRDFDRSWAILKEHRRRTVAAVRARMARD